MTCTCLSCGRNFRAFGSPKSYCHPCRCQAKRAMWRAAQRKRRETSPPSTDRRCAECGTDIRDRDVRAVYCDPCVESHQRQSTARVAQDRKADRAGVASWRRDLRLEAAIDAHLAAIKASRRFRLTAEIIWARRVDLVAAQAQDLGDLGTLRSEAQREAERRSRARKRALAQAGQRGAA